MGGETAETLKESIEKELAAINKEAEHEILASKLEKIDAAIEKRQSQLSKLDEDEDMKALTDKTKIKALQKDIKTLEKAKSKLEKMMSKHKGKIKKTEVIDETEEDIDLDVAPEYVENANERVRDGQTPEDATDTYTNLSPDERDDLEDYLEDKEANN